MICRGLCCYSPRMYSSFLFSCVTPKAAPSGTFTRLSLDPPLAAGGDFLASLFFCLEKGYSNATNRIAISFTTLEQA